MVELDVIAGQSYVASIGSGGNGGYGGNGNPSGGQGFSGQSVLFRTMETHSRTANRRT